MSNSSFISLTSTCSIITNFYRLRGSSRDVVACRRQHLFCNLCNAVATQAWHFFPLKRTHVDCKHPPRLDRIVFRLGQFSGATPPSVLACMPILRDTPVLDCVPILRSPPVLDCMAAPWPSLRGGKANSNKAHSLVFVLKTRPGPMLGSIPCMQTYFKRCSKLARGCPFIT